MVKNQSTHHSEETFDFYFKPLVPSSVQMDMVQHKQQKTDSDKISHGFAPSCTPPTVGEGVIILLMK